MTDIATPIFIKPGVDLEESLRAIAEAGATMIELRCDTAPEKMILAAIDEASLPVIVTIRPTWEGGNYKGSENTRLDLIEAAMEAGADYVDVELVAWEKSRDTRDRISDAIEKNGTKLIISNHSFDARPADLAERLARLRAVKDASILKIAWKAESILDAVEALRLTREHKAVERRPLLALAMGEEGGISRLLAAKFGSPLTFASLERGQESAPGQPTIAELRGLYRWDKQRRNTPVFGVIGWPVGHSLSPHIHNAGFDARNLDGVYVPLAIRPEYAAFKAAVDALRACGDMNLRGLSVTIPHKDNALRYAADTGATIDPLARSIGAVNTLVFPKSGPASALNTDYAGALDALVAAMGPAPADIAGATVAVIGAGGAARAIVAALAANGASVTIYNRTRERAAALAAEFSGKTGVVTAEDWSRLPHSTCRICINCTPLGMHPKVDASPVDFDPAWNARTIVFDTIYNPHKTQLLQLAEKKGATIITGLEMFVRQAAIQFRAFTGQEAPADLFRKVLRATLA